MNGKQLHPHRGHKNSRGQNSVKQKAEPHHLNHRYRLHQPLGTGIQGGKHEGGGGNQRNTDLTVLGGVAKKLRHRLNLSLNWGQINIVLTLKRHT